MNATEIKECLMISTANEAAEQLAIQFKECKSIKIAKFIFNLFLGILIGMIAMLFIIYK